MAQIIGPNGTYIEEPVAPKTASGSSVMLGSDGHRYNVPDSSYNIAIKNGWKPLSDQEVKEGDETNKQLDNTSANEAHGLDKLLTFGSAAGPLVSLYHGLTDKPTRGHSDTFTNEGFGIPNYVADKMHPENASRENAIDEALAQRDPISHAAATVGGFIAPALVPGVGEAGDAVGNVVARGLEKAAAKKMLEEGAIKATAEGLVKEGVEKSLTSKLASQAANYATQGAIYSTPKAAVQLAYGDPEQAAETMLWGIGLSAVAGAGSGLIGAGLKGAASKLGDVVESHIPKLLEKQENGITYADDLARNVLGISDKEAKKLGPDNIAKMVERSDQLGILQSSNKTKMAKDLLSDSGKRIGDHLESLQAVLEKNPDDLNQLVSSPMKVGQEFQNELLSKHPEIGTETHSDVLKTAVKIQNDMMAYGNEPSFTKLQELRDVLKKGKKAFDRDTPQAEMYRVADGIIQSHIEKSAQNVYNAGNENMSFADYLKNKFDYRLASTLLKNDNPFKGTGRFPFTNLGSLFGNNLASTTTKAGLLLGTGHPLAAGYVGASYALKKLLTNEAMQGKGISMLRAASKDPASIPIIGGLMAKQGQMALDTHLDKIPEFITSAKAPYVATKAGQAIKDFLGDKANGQSKENQYNLATNQIKSMAIDSVGTADKVGRIASTFTGTSTQLASLVAQKKLDAIAYLANEIPKNPNPPQPFETNNTWKPTAQQKAAFESKLAVVMDPMSVWNKIQNNTITNDEIKTLKTVYPKIYQSMVGAVVKTSADPNIGGKVSTNKKMALSKFTGIPLTPGLRNLSFNQSVLSQPTLQSSPQSSSGRHSGSAVKGTSERYMTNTQRLGAK